MNIPINSKKAPAPIGPYNQAVLAGNMLFVSGQIAIDPESNKLVTASIELETKRVLDNLVAILKNAEFTLKDVVKTTIFLSNMDYFSKVNDIYSSYFESGVAPARECVAVKTLPKEVNVEISAIAVRS